MFNSQFLLSFDNLSEKLSTTIGYLNSSKAHLLPLDNLLYLSHKHTQWKYLDFFYLNIFLICYHTFVIVLFVFLSENYELLIFATSNMLFKAVYILKNLLFQIFITEHRHRSRLGWTWAPSSRVKLPLYPPQPLSLLSGLAKKSKIFLTQNSIISISAAKRLPTQMFCPSPTQYVFFI